MFAARADVQDEYVRHQAEEGVFTGPTELTVGTWNLLHPTYAVKYSEVEGIRRANAAEGSPAEARRFEIPSEKVGLVIGKGGVTVQALQKEARGQGIQLKVDAKKRGAPGRVELKGGSDRDCAEFKERILAMVGGSGSGESNWPDRAPEIGDRLLKGGLDVYLLQEVGESQLDDLQPYISELYELRFAVHPGRGAKDGVAVLVRKARLQIEESHTLKILSKEFMGHHYMSAMLVTARDVATGARVLVVSAHFFAKKAVDPRGTLLTELARRFAGDNPPDLVVWGGDCNEVYHSPFFSGAFRTADGGCPTRFRGKKKIDWIFAGGAALSEVVRSEATRRFVEVSSEPILASGQPASDHLAEAVCIRSALPGPLEANKIRERLVAARIDNPDADGTTPDNPRGCDARATALRANSTVQAAGMVVFRRVPKGEIEYLLVASKRALKKHRKAWTPPKGHRKVKSKKAAIKEYSENELDAALRETYEETGLAVDDAMHLLSPEPVHTVEYQLEAPTHNVPSGWKRTAYFVAELVGDHQVVCGDDVDQYVWRRLAGAKEMVRSEMAELLERADSVINRRHNSNLPPSAS
eukprot:Tamp_05749.p1 GENE.Tamp_05749~~Tamp_05749.p1  ORF type:complete len:583 (-),score=96.97 Tamp_05749:583-2331(-)